MPVDDDGFIYGPHTRKKFHNYVLSVCAVLCPVYLMFVCNTE
jgi:hypothetical protein